jgi:hypothetical protein
MSDNRLSVCRSHGERRTQQSGQEAHHDGSRFHQSSLAKAARVDARSHDVMHNRNSGSVRVERDLGLKAHAMRVASGFDVSDRIASR